MVLKPDTSRSQNCSFQEFELVLSSLTKSREDSISLTSAIIAGHIRGGGDEIEGYVIDIEKSVVRGICSKYRGLRSVVPQLALP